ncbi:MAG: hypothetical protein SFW67_16310, partial [Myxococcaceae bacterium]|nr:hypothetical protein [Myxococcaceae bacterium]
APDGGALPTGQGLVFVYARRDNSFLRNGLLRPAFSQRNDRFGHSVSLSSDGARLAVGATGDFSGTGDPADDSVVNAGAVHVYRFLEARWQPFGFVTPPAPLPDSRFGSHVALSGDGLTLAAGAIGHSTGLGGVNPPLMESAPTSGAAFVFTLP